MVPAVRDWLEDNPRWLVILDNADNPQRSSRCCPRAGDGHALVTSQLEDDLDRRADLIPLDVLSPEEATQFLLTRTGQNDLAAAGQLAEVLGCLPLAVEQAGASEVGRPPREIAIPRANVDRLQAAPSYVRRLSSLVKCPLNDTEPRPATPGR